MYTVKLVDTDLIINAVKSNEALKRVVDFLLIYGPEEVPESIRDDIRFVGTFIEFCILNSEIES